MEPVIYMVGSPAGTVKSNGQVVWSAGQQVNKGAKNNAAMIDCE